MKPPKPIKAGPPWLQSAYNQLLKFAIESRPVNSEGALINRTPDGSQIIPQLTPASGGAGASSQKPFTIFATTNGSEESPAPRVGITPSTIGGIIPATLLFTPAAGVRYLHIKITIVVFPKQLSTVEIIDSSSASIADTATVRHAPLGSYTFTDDTLSALVNYGYGPIGFQLCYNWFSNPTTTGHTFTFN